MSTAVTTNKIEIPEFVVDFELVKKKDQKQLQIDDDNVSISSCEDIETYNLRRIEEQKYVFDEDEDEEINTKQVKYGKAENFILSQNTKIAILKHARSQALPYKLKHIINDTKKNIARKEMQLLGKQRNLDEEKKTISEQKDHEKHYKLEEKQNKITEKLKKIYEAKKNIIADEISNRRNLFDEKYVLYPKIVSGIVQIFTFYKYMFNVHNRQYEHYKRFNHSNIGLVNHIVKKKNNDLNGSKYNDDNSHNRLREELCVLIDFECEKFCKLKNLPVILLQDLENTPYESEIYDDFMDMVFHGNDHKYSYVLTIKNFIINNRIFSPEFEMFF